MNDVFRTSLFPQGYRASGVALDIAALPSPYGIGDVGPATLRWIDRLRDAGQRWWHALEFPGSGYCDSVYPSYSSFAGNTLLISPDWLMEDGLLNRRDCECVSFPSDTIDYDVVVPFKHWLLEKAWTRFNGGMRKDLLRGYEQFRKNQAHWLEDYALFRALKAIYRGANWIEWPADLVRRETAALAAARRELARQVDQERFSQFLLFRQTERLKEYAHAQGVRLIGDSPRVIPSDSSDAWANRELFAHEAKDAAAFTTDLTPLCLKSSGSVGLDNPGALNHVSHRWCVDRLRALLAHVDVARVDVPEFAVPRRAAVGATAVRVDEYGGMGLLSDGDLFAHGKQCTRGDGLPHPDLRQAVETRVLQFAFDGSSDNRHLPENYTADSVVYTSPNDESRTRAWFEGLPDQRRQAVWNCLKLMPGATEAVPELIRLAWSSKAALSIVTVPDLLNLGNDPITSPAGAEGHSRWRCSEEVLPAHVLSWLRDLTRSSNRSVEEQTASKRVALSSTNKSRSGGMIIRSESVGLARLEALSVSAAVSRSD